MLPNSWTLNHYRPLSCTNTMEKTLSATSRIIFNSFFVSFSVLELNSCETKTQESAVPSYSEICWKSTSEKSAMEFNFILRLLTALRRIP